jgi:hypothetical protein
MKLTFLGCCCNCQKTGQSKQLPIRRKFAQSGHPVASQHTYIGRRHVGPVCFKLTQNKERGDWEKPWLGHYSMVLLPPVASWCSQLLILHYIQLKESLKKFSIYRLTLTLKSPLNEFRHTRNLNKMCVTKMYRLMKPVNRGQTQSTMYVESRQNCLKTELFKIKALTYQDTLRYDKPVASFLREEFTSCTSKTRKARPFQR